MAANHGRSCSRHCCRLSSILQHATGACRAATKSCCWSDGEQLTTLRHGLLALCCCILCAKCGSCLCPAMFHPASMQTSAKPPLKIISAAEVAQHNTKDKRVWVTYKEGVYDVSIPMNVNKLSKCHAQCNGQHQPTSRASLATPAVLPFMSGRQLVMLCAVYCKVHSRDP